MWQNLIKANTAYAIGSVANSAALFLLLPFLVNSLSAEAYGEWSILEVTILLLNMIILAGLDVSLMRYYWFLKNDNEQARLMGTVLVAVGSWGVIVSGIIILLLFGGAFDISSYTTYRNLGLVLSISCIESLFILQLSLFRICEKPITYASLSVFKMLLFVGATILLVHFEYGVTGILIGRLASAIIILIIATLFALKFIKFCFDKDVFAPVLRYGLPLLPNNLAGYILLASDRFILGKVGTLEAVAIYSFAYKIATTVDLIVIRPFAIDWAPRRFKIAISEDAKHKYAQVLILYLVATISFALLILAVIPELYEWFAPPIYYEGMHIVPIILVAFITLGLTYPLNIGIMLENKTKYMPFISGLAAIICLILNFWWIPIYGMLGAAWATVIAYSVRSLGVAFFSLKLYSIPYRIEQILFVILIGIIGYGGIRFLEISFGTEFGWFAFAFKLCWSLLVVALMLFYLFKFVLDSPPVLNKTGKSTEQMISSE